MKLLVFSDIHGNGYVMSEFLEKIMKIEYDKIIFCGDIFGYYYDQKEIINMLKKIPDLIWIKGNHDNYFLKIYEGQEEDEKYICKYGTTYGDIQEKYSEEIFNLIKKLPESADINANGKRIGIFHGTPDDKNEGRLYPDNEIIKGEEYEKYDIVILGHTHCRMERKYKDTYIVNSGSLGQPRDGNSFGFAIIDTESESVVFEDINIDCDNLYSDIQKNDSDLHKLIEVLERRKNK